MRLKGATMSYDALSFDSIAGEWGVSEFCVELTGVGSRKGDSGGTCVGVGTGGI